MLNPTCATDTPAEWKTEERPVSLYVRHVDRLLIHAITKIVLIVMSTLCILATCANLSFSFLSLPLLSSPGSRCYQYFNARAPGYSYSHKKRGAVTVGGSTRQIYMLHATM